LLLLHACAAGCVLQVLRYCLVLILPHCRFVEPLPWAVSADPSLPLPPLTTCAHLTCCHHYVYSLPVTLRSATVHTTHWLLRHCTCSRTVIALCVGTLPRCRYAHAHLLACAHACRTAHVLITRLVTFLVLALVELLRFFCRCLAHEGGDLRVLTHAVVQVPHIRGAGTDVGGCLTRGFCDYGAVVPHVACYLLPASFCWWGMLFWVGAVGRPLHCLPHLLHYATTHLRLGSYYYSCVPLPYAGIPDTTHRTHTCLHTNYLWRRIYAFAAHALRTCLRASDLLRRALRAAWILPPLVRVGSSRLLICRAPYGRWFVRCC